MLQGTTIGFVLAVEYNKIKMYSLVSHSLYTYWLLPSFRIGAIFNNGALNVCETWEEGIPETQNE